MSVLWYFVRIIFGCTIPAWILQKGCCVLLRMSHLEAYDVNFDALLVVSASFFTDYIGTIFPLQLKSSSWEDTLRTCTYLALHQTLASRLSIHWWFLLKPVFTLMATKMVMFHIHHCLLFYWHSTIRKSSLLSTFLFHPSTAFSPCSENKSTWKAAVHFQWYQVRELKVMEASLV